MSTISTHVLDTTIGRPAAGVPIVLERMTSEDDSVVIGHGVTDGDGRIRDLVRGDEELRTGQHRLVFNVQSYYNAQGSDAFYPTVTIHFRITDAAAHYHIPLLLSPFGYSTYRGS